MQNNYISEKLALKIVIHGNIPPILARIKMANFNSSQRRIIYSLYNSGHIQYLTYFLNISPRKWVKKRGYLKEMRDLQNTQEHTSERIVILINVVFDFRIEEHLKVYRSIIKDTKEHQ
jgi:hypothetical protein